MSTKAAALAKAKKDEVKKVREQITIFDGLLERYYEAPAIIPGVSKKPYGPSSRGPFSRGNRERLVAEVRSSIGKLQRSRQVLMDLIKNHHVNAPEVSEMKEIKHEIEQRMEREIQWQADFKKTPASDKALTQETVLTAEQQTTRTALEFLQTTIERLRRQVEVDSATVERLLAKNAKLLADDQEEDKDDAEQAERIGDLNDEREWHTERLEKAFIASFLDSNEEKGFDIDRTIYRPFGLDLSPSRETPQNNVPQAVGHRGAVSHSVSAAAGGRLDDVRPPLKAKTEIPARAPPAVTNIRPQPASAVSQSTVNGLEKKRNLRTIPCKSFAARQSCPYIETCSFLHILPGSDVDVREKARASKTPCKYQEEFGGCRRRDCYFLHDAPINKSTSLFDFIGKKYPALAVEDVDIPPESSQVPSASAATSAAKPVNPTPSYVLPSQPSGSSRFSASSAKSAAMPVPYNKAAALSPAANVSQLIPRALAPVVKPVAASAPTPAHSNTGSSVATSESFSSRSQSSAMSDVGSISSDASYGSVDFSPHTPPSGSSIVAANRMPDGVLPLGSGACLNHHLQGVCLNGLSCLGRHTLNANDQAVGVLPLLGPLACLGWHLKGFCLNGDACKASHRLTESDYGVVAFDTPRTNDKANSISDDRQRYEDYRNSLIGISRSVSPKVQPVGAVRKPPQLATLVPNPRRTFTDPRMKDSRFRDQCCQFFLQGSCPYGSTCTEIHPRGAFDLEIEENATSFFVPDSDSEDE